MTLNEHSRGLSELRQKLSQSRARARRQLLLRALTWSVGSACALYLSLYLLGLIWPSLPWVAWGWAGLFFVAVFGVTGSWALLSTPTLLDLARRADRQFGLYERSSTALEFAAAPQTGTNAELIEALMADAERLAPRIEPRKLIPIRVPRSAWLTLALIGAIGAVHLLPTTLRPGDVAPAEALAEDVRVETVTSLRQTAELLSEEAEAQQDPYLQALAQAFDELSDQVEAGTLGEAETQLELNRLMEHLSRAFGGEAAPSETLAEEGDDTQALEETQQANRPPSINDPAPNLSDLLNELAQVEAELQAAKENRAANRGKVTLADIQEFGPYLNPESLEALREAQERREEEAVRAGQPIGAAQESEAGAGDFAGKGTQDLGEAGADAFEAIETRADEVLLPESEDTTGEQIKLELSPETQFTEVTDDGDVQALSWQASKETEVRHDLLLPRDRVVVSRYFERPEEVAVNR